MTNESGELPVLVPIKSKIADYTKDVPLNRIPHEEALKFLGPSLVCYLRITKLQITHKAVEICKLLSPYNLDHRACARGLKLKFQGVLFKFGNVWLSIRDR